MTDLDEKTPVISLECQKLMFMLGAWAAGKFAEVPEAEQIKLGAMFELSADQMLAATKEFSQLCAAFSANRKQIMAKWLRARH